MHLRPTISMTEGRMCIGEGVLKHLKIIPGLIILSATVLDACPGYHSCI